MFLCTTVHCPGTTNSPGLWTLSLYRYGSQSLAPQTASTASYSHCCTPHHKQRTTSSWCPSRSWWSSPQPTAITQAEREKKIAYQQTFCSSFCISVQRRVKFVSSFRCTRWGVELKSTCHFTAYVRWLSPNSRYSEADFKSLRSEIFWKVNRDQTVGIHAIIIWAAKDNDDNLTLYAPCIIL